MFRFRDKYDLDLIEKYKSLVYDLQEVLSKFKTDSYNRYPKLSCIKEKYGLNVVVLNKDLLGNDCYLIYALKELSKKDRKKIVQFAVEGICDKRIDDVEDRL